MREKNRKKKKILVILGPTAVGKTSLAIKIAKRRDGEIISADSCQVYKYMDIGTNKPPEDCEIKHHLVDFLEPSERFNAMEFMKRAENIIGELLEREKLPIIAGGTGLYIRALREGLFTGGFKDDKVREKLRRKSQRGENLYSFLEKIDPVAAEKIHPNNYVRIQRALEVYFISGKPISFWWEKGKHKTTPYNYVLVGIKASREKLYRRAEDRVDRMLEKGLVEEVEDLIEMGYDEESPGFESIGYSEIYHYLQDKISLEEASSRMKKNTRHYIKKQLTFFKSEDDVKWFNRDEYAGTQELMNNVLKYWDSF